MHIPDGMLDVKTVATGWAAALPAVGWAVRAVRRRTDEGRLVLMSVLAAMIFALQMLNFPVAGGTSGHFAGGALAAILLGPWPAVLVMTSVLIVQALVFADGGVAALGANVLDMAIVAPLAGWLAYSLVLRMRGTRAGRAVAAFVSGWVACVAAALGAAVLIWASGAAPLLPVAGAMGLWHAVIGLGEGLVTAGLVSYVHAIRPGLLTTDEQIMRPRSLIISFGAIALVAALLSFLASSRPDALEYVARGMSSMRDTPAAWGSGLLPGYVVPGISNQTLAGVLAGVAGLLVTGALTYAALAALRRRATRA